MSTEIKPEIYRRFIDHMVEVCHNGQGQISAQRFANGVWNQNATSEYLQDQDEINLLLKRLTISDRKIIAKLLCSEVELGVFESLKALEEFEIPPFQSGYEGSPFNDGFMTGNGRKNNLWIDFRYRSRNIAHNISLVKACNVLASPSNKNIFVMQPGRNVIIFDGLRRP